MPDHNLIVGADAGILFEGAEIGERCAALAAELDAEIEARPGKYEGVVFLTILAGGARFLFELLAYLPASVRYEFVRASSRRGRAEPAYKNAPVSRQSVRVDVDDEAAALVKGRCVYLVDDVEDSGGTLAAVTETLLTKYGATEVSPVVLCSKRPGTTTRRAFDVSPEDYLIGFGMDHGRSARNLSAIVAIRVRAQIGTKEGET